MDLDTTKDAAAECNCGCKDGVCMCDGETCAVCDCADCKAKTAPAEPSETEAPQA
ncbi:MAG: hypothetical protein KA028_03205 [Candidatus Pacebacteria bacterium]|nr:hypothetical protein [Candidatus Paceibacterota bacterium]MBP9851920.1 hypothetical protein [Candidatus Paceibacterota bacterium]